MPKKVQQPLRILVAEDDPDDRLLIKEAIGENRMGDILSFVEDGQELIDYLKQRGIYKDNKSPVMPLLILLDLNMPRLDGREALKIIKADPELRRIPVIAFTTSTAEQDILESYNLGVSGYINKPVTFEGLLEVMRKLNLYWIETVELPVSGSLQ